MITEYHFGLIGIQRNQKVVMIYEYDLLILLNIE